MGHLIKQIFCSTVKCIGKSGSEWVDGALNHKLIALRILLL